MDILPEQYCESMKILLGEEYSEYIASLSESSHTAFRINTGKISLEEWDKMNPFSTNRVPWTDKGFYYDANIDMPSKHPYYFAGLYYIQEPSAMIPASILPVEPGDKVLDLCAAPGGKATELGAKLNQTGLLVANDISVSRTMALAKNIQMAGISNAVVTAETPEHLSQVFVNYFDKILIDAPCSGEGMFRREPRMIKDWLEKGPEYYAVIQKEILSYAYQMLKPGGMLVYSTCTFSVKEDEEVVQWLLDEYSDMKICAVERKEGFSKGRPDLLLNGSKELKHCIRIFPHRAEGEGHFAVLLQKEITDKKLKNESCLNSSKAVSHEKKTGDASDIEIIKYDEKFRNAIPNGSQKKGKKGKKVNCVQRQVVEEEEIKEFLAKLALGKKDSSRKLSIEKGKITWELSEFERNTSLRIIYRGLAICEIKNKINLSPQLALTLTKDDYDQVIDFDKKDEHVIRYLKGETLQVEEKYKGDILICVDGYGLGWCKGNGQGTLKNKYYPGWRYQ